MWIVEGDATPQGDGRERLDDHGRRDGRGRLVMLVDNRVEGDSRVQKAARSAADRGWDVTLLGCTATGPERTWRIGRAQVHVLPMSRGSAGAAATSAAQPDSSAGSARGSLASLKQRLLTHGGWPLRVARLARRPLEHAQVIWWRNAEGDRAWRHLEPGLWNYERLFGPLIDELAPDVIHAHDFRMLGVGARAVERARSAGRRVKLVWDVHEFLPGMKPWRDNARWLPAHLAYEREYAPYADAVITVSDALAGMLVAEHHLAVRPTVVMNAPDVTAGGATTDDVPDIRALCGIDASTPLLVYGGSASVQRGLRTVIDALPRLPGVHFAMVVADPSAPHIRRYMAAAVRLGVADRTHALPYVPHQQVSAFLSAADVGVIPIHHWPNHEIALITKFFEYSHARLPIVVSDVKTMAEAVRATGQGEVFRARDTADFVRAVQAVLADPKRYRAAYEGPDSPLAGWTWDAQADRLDAIYRSLLTDDAPPRTAATDLDPATSETGSP
jgi:glycosyltransferase involved in cell wall biosynthesis